MAQSIYQSPNFKRSYWKAVSEANKKQTAQTQIDSLLLPTIVSSSAEVAISAITPTNVISHNTHEVKTLLTCSVCLESLTAMASTKCGHVFCRDCIHRAIHATKRCPLCNADAKLKDVRPLFL